jgi:hypothetical protein
MAMFSNLCKRARNFPLNITYVDTVREPDGMLNPLVVRVASIIQSSSTVKAFRDISATCEASGCVIKTPNVMVLRKQIIVKNTRLKIQSCSGLLGKD